MRVFHRAPRLPDAFRGAAVAIGNFDGVHRGHRAVLDAARALVPGAAPGVLTFEPHPREVLQPDRAPARLTPLAAKLRLLREAGARFVQVLRFDRALIAMPAEAFVREVLVERLGAAGVAVGQDFRFGHGRGGDPALLTWLGPILGFRASVVTPLAVDGEPCSSTRVRELLGDGHVALAAALLGRPHAVEGRVVRGDGRGRQIGFPTANLALRGRRPMLPAAGVYAVTVRPRPGGAVVWPGVANLGHRPTFEGRELRLEVHLLDRGPDLYGTPLEVGFVERLRGEMRFDGIESLRAQIARDVAQARAVHGLDPDPGRVG